MSDDKKTSKNVDGEGQSAAPDASIPEVEAEIVEDPAMRKGDLLREAAPDGDAAEIASEDNADDSVDSVAEDVTSPPKPKTPGVAIFTIFAICALAIVAFWIWQVRSNDMQAPSIAPGAMQDQPEPDQSLEPERAIAAPSEGASRDVGDQGVAAATASPEPVSMPPLEQEAAVIVSDSMQPDVESANDAPPFVEEPLSLPIETFAEGEGLENTPLTEEASSIDPVGGDAALEEAQPASENSDINDIAQNAAKSEGAAVDAIQNDQAAAETISDEGAVPEETSVDVVAADNAAEQIPDDQFETLNEEFSRTVERLSAELEAERERSKALEAEMASLRQALGAEDASRGAEADATIAALRAELDAAQRALEARPEAANAATAAISKLASAVEAGEPFAAELDAVAAFAGDDAVLELFRVRAAQGVPTRQELKDDFREPARKAMAAVAQEQAEGPLGNLVARVKSVISIRPANALPGDSPRAVMSRIEDAVRRDAFTLAISQISALPQAAQVELQEWVMSARAHEDVRRALTELNSVVITQAAR